MTWLLFSVKQQFAVFKFWQDTWKHKEWLRILGCGICIILEVLDAKIVKIACDGAPKTLKNKKDLALTLARIFLVALLITETQL